jgi:hypothetical protein
VKRTFPYLALAFAAACASGLQKRAEAPVIPSDAETPMPTVRSAPAAGAVEAKAGDSKSRAALERALEQARRGDYTSAESELKQLVDRSPGLDYA